MSTHTPGPWAWFAMRHNAAGRRLRGPNAYVTEIGGDGISDADARLIAAVPDLLAALAALVDDSWSEISGQPCVPDKATVEAARAALAKAGAR